MRKVYEHIDFSRVGHFQSILESAGIATHIKNLGANAGAGDIPFTEVYPELWVASDDDYERSIAMLEPYFDHQQTSGSAWTCPQCKEVIEGSFGQCWNCETMKPVDRLIG